MNLWGKHVSPKHQVTATGNTLSTLQIGCRLHYGDIQRFLKLKLDEKYVEMLEKALIFTFSLWQSDGSVITIISVCELRHIDQDLD